MFCGECGEPIGSGNKYCNSCGAPVEGLPEYARTQTGRSRASAFFSSPAGIVTIIAISLVAIAGIVVGAILATRDGTEKEVEERTSQTATQESEVTDEDEKQTTPEDRDVKHARETMDDFLAEYVSGGWCSGSHFMTSHCYDKFCSESATAPPPDQGDFEVVDASVADYKVIDEDTILFTILQRDRLTEDGSEYEYNREFDMKKEDGTWLVNDCYKLE